MVLISLLVAYLLLLATGRIEHIPLNGENTSKEKVNVSSGIDPTGNDTSISDFLAGLRPAIGRLLIHRQGRARTVSCATL